MKYPQVEMSARKFFCAVSVALLMLLVAIPASGKDKLPRKHDAFDLGALYDDLAPRLSAFNCRDLGSVAGECTIMGYPRRDDFMVLKFYKGELVAIAHFLEGVSYDEALDDARRRFGDPSMPAYKSDRAISYIWKDNKTYITLTHLIPLSYVVYEIRDIEKEPLFRKARLWSE